MSHRVLHIITGLATGGAETMLYKLLAAGLHSPDDVMVVSLWDRGVLGPDIEKLGIRVECLGMRRGLPSLKGIKRLRALVHEFRPELIQGWMYHGNLAAAIACRWALPGTRLSWNVRHSLYDLKREKLLTRQVIRANRLLSSRVDGILYNSELSRQQHQAFGFCPSRGRVIGNGFDVEEFSPDKEGAAAIRASLDIPMDADVVGHVARFHPMKNHAGFLQAMAPVLASNPQLHLLMVGKGVDLSNPQLKRGLAALPVERVHLLGQRNDVAMLMSAMDLFCLNSTSEAFPNVLGEAMASCLLCVATDVGDCADVLGDTGRVVEPHNKVALQSAIEEELKLLPVQRQQLGCAARDRVSEYFSIEAVTELYNLFYQQLLGKSC